MHQLGDPDNIQLMIDDAATRMVVFAQPCDMGDTLPVLNDDTPPDNKKSRLILYEQSGLRLDNDY